MLTHIGRDLRSTMLDCTHPTWHSMLMQALMCMSNDYLYELKMTQDWLPGSFSDYTNNHHS